MNNKEKASISEYNQSEMNRIKKMNHNFSDIFGLEYGQRGELKGRNYELKANDTPKSNNVFMVVNIGLGSNEEHNYGLKIFSRYSQFV